MIKCHQCKFYVQTTDANDSWIGGECRFDAPKFLGNQSPPVDGEKHPFFRVWPEVYMDDGCGKGDRLLSEEGRS